jgi:ribokinase
MVGSANMDIVFAVERIPRPGETLLADSAARYPGGKGLNQAVAAARAGATTTIVAAVGRDDSGHELERVMIEAGIDTGLVRHDDAQTGQAFIVVDGSGENTIIVASGANASMTSLRADDRRAVAADSVLLMQLELPLAVVAEAAAVARAAGVTVMLNAAPARRLPREILADVDVLIVNEHEACLLGDSDDLAAASAAIAAIVHRVIVTLGADGSALYEGGAEVARIAAPQVEAVDTTGAGDTFCGAFAAAFAEGAGFAAAARFATAAAALSVQTLGAVPSVPHRVAIDDLLERLVP